ncbi:hypothetical protein ACFVKB_46770 [Rhodococcus sp. NPDC127530]|uniref:hypothetical protein n=1 Tax=unclassified Rhodococcus (in: high G+C Gram-positive bacteria) TaxID=192944 RepID=UPI00363A52C4
MIGGVVVARPVAHAQRRRALGGHLLCPVDVVVDRGDECVADQLQHLVGQSSAQIDDRAGADAQGDTQRRQ